MFRLFPPENSVTSQYKAEKERSFSGKLQNVDYGVKKICIEK